MPSEDLNVPNVALQQELMKRKLLSQPAGMTGSSIMKAMEAVRKAYPSDMSGVRVKTLPMTDRLAFSNTLADTPIPWGNMTKGLTQDTKDQEFLKKMFPDNPGNVIEINPGVDAGYPESQMEVLIAHELEHIRQNKAMGSNTDDRLHQFSMPYADRPDEKDAQMAQDRYAKSKHYDEDGIGNDMPSNIGSVMNYLGKIFTKSQNK